jgi:2-iminobutanoate/2-iminopropanoate deaminase
MSWILADKAKLSIDGWRFLYRRDLPTANATRRRLIGASAASPEWKPRQTVCEDSATPFAGDHSEYNAMQFIVLPDDADLGLPFSTALRVDDILYLSGAIGNRPGTLSLVEGGIAAEARQAMDNIGRTLETCGLAFEDVFKCTIMLADMSEWRTFNEVYVAYFAKGRLPARSAFGASGLALGARVEIECLARFP